MKRILVFLFLLLSAPAFADDRTDLQTEIDALAGAGGGTVYLEPREYRLTQTPGTFYSLVLPGNVNLVGAGEGLTLLTQENGAGASQRLLYVYGKTSISDLSLFGNKAYQTADVHRAGVLVKDATEVTLRHVTSFGFTGDGLVLYSGSNITLDSVTVFDNARDGIAMTPGSVVPLVNVVLKDSKVFGNTAQQVDSEPGVSVLVSKVQVYHNTIDGTGSNDYALAVGGSGTDYRTLDWQVFDNQIVGGTLIGWAENVDFHDNHVMNSTTKSAVTVYRSSKLVTVRDNALYQTQTSAANIGVVFVSGTGIGSMPSGITISGNRITTNAPNFGMRVEVTQDILILGNYVYGASYGIYLRTTIPLYPFYFALIQGNYISGFTVAGVYAAGNTGAQLIAITLANNYLEGTGIGAVLSDAFHSTQTAVVSGNTCLNTSACITNLPPISRVF